MVEQPISFEEFIEETKGLRYDIEIRRCVLIDHTITQNLRNVEIKVLNNEVIVGEGYRYGITIGSDINRISNTDYYVCLPERRSQIYFYKFEACLIRMGDVVDKIMSGANEIPVKKINYMDVEDYAYCKSLWGLIIKCNYNLDLIQLAIETKLFMELCPGLIKRGINYALQYKRRLGLHKEQVSD